MSGFNLLSKISPFAGYRQPNPLDPYGETNTSGEEDPFATLPAGFPENRNNPFNPSLPVEPPEPAGPKYMNSSLNQYRDSLRDQPMQNDYRPSKKRTFGAIALGGLAGMAANNPQMAYGMAKEITRQPYNTAMEEWKTTTSGYKDAANIEELENTHEFNRYIQQARVDDLARDRRNRDEDRDAARKITQQNADTTSRRADIAASLAGGNKLFQDVSGNVWRVPNTGGPATLDPKLKALSFEDRLMLENAGRMVLQNDRQFFQAQQTAEAREAERIAKEKEANAKLAAGDQTVVTEVEPTADEQIKQIRLDIARLVHDNPDYEGNVDIGETGLPVFRPSSLSYMLRRAGAEGRDKAFKEKFDKILRGEKDTRRTERVTTKGAGGAAPAKPTPPKTEPEPMPISIDAAPPPANQRRAGVTTKWFKGDDGMPELRRWDGSAWVTVVGANTPKPK